MHKKTLTFTREFDGFAGNRTLDQWLKRPLLYQLSYKPETQYINKNAVQSTKHRIKLLGLCSDTSRDQQ